MITQIKEVNKMISGSVMAKMGMLIPRALAGDPSAIAILATMGVVIAVAKLADK